jgi:Cof subfamily protein (haloacid dehalogenase superfamily)
MSARGGIAQPSRAGPFSVVATDLDGTLLRTDLTVSARTRQVLAAVRNAGAHHVVVTGRPASGCGPLLRAMGYGGIAVCGQGAQLYDAAAHRLLATVTLDRAVAREFVDRLAAVTGPLTLAVLTAGLDGQVRLSPGFLSGTEYERYTVESERCTVATDELLWEQPIEKVLVRHRALSDEALVAAAAEVDCADIAVIYSGERMLELLPAGIDKAVGLAAVTERFGVEAAEVIAFGDMPNDIAMLEWAGYAVAMDNAHPRLREVADEVAPSNDRDGVAAVLERIFPVEERVP